MQRSLAGSCVAILALVMCASASAQNAAPPSPEAAAGAAIYAERCATCHDSNEGRAPPRFYLETRLPREVVQVLTKGPMKPMAAGLNDAQIRSLAVFLTGRAPGPGSEPDPHANMCADDGGPIQPGDGDWTGWGHDVRNTRYQPKPGFTVADLPKLKVKWAFALPGVVGEPVPAAGRLFVTSRLGMVFALDAKTGCTRWSYDAGSAARNALTLGALPASAAAPYAVFFGDLDATVQALDARTGKLLWKTKIEDYPMARVLGSVTYYKGRIYAPVTSNDELSAADPSYPCCTFRGSLVALDAATGKILWKSYTSLEKPKPTRKSSTGTQLYGSSGAGIWSAPTIDAKRGLVYVGTGDAYTAEPIDASDSIVAFDLETGKRMWVSQVNKNDGWIYHCTGMEGQGNCPKHMGPDFDFSSPPMLHTLPDGKEVLLAGSKAATLYAFDPDNKGKLLWKVSVGIGNSNDPIWGSTAEGGRAFVGTPGPSVEKPNPAGGLTGVDIATGKVAWHTPAPTPKCDWGDRACEYRQPGALTAIPGAVFGGSLDGHIRAYSAKDGAILWDLDTGTTFDGVNGVKAHGGNIDGAAQTVANGTLFVSSGNGTMTSPHPGDAVLAITVDGQ